MIYHYLTFGILTVFHQSLNEIIDWPKIKFVYFELLGIVPLSNNPKWFIRKLIKYNCV